MTQQVSTTNNNSNWLVNPEEGSTSDSGATQDLAKRCEAAVANVPIGNSEGMVTVTARAGNGTDSTSKSGATQDLAQRCEAVVADIPIGNSGGKATATVQAGNNTDSAFALQVEGYVETVGGKRINYSNKPEKENPAELEEAEAAIQRHLRALLASGQPITITHQVSGGTHLKTMSTNVSAAPTKSSERRKD